MITIIISCNLSLKSKIKSQNNQNLLPMTVRWPTMVHDVKHSSTMGTFSSKIEMNNIPYWFWNQNSFKENSKLCPTTPREHITILVPVYRKHIKDIFTIYWHKNYRICPPLLVKLRQWLLPLSSAVHSGLGLGSGQFNNTLQCLECQPNACSKRQGLQKPSKSNQPLNQRITLFVKMSMYNHTWHVKIRLFWLLNQLTHL